MKPRFNRFNQPRIRCVLCGKLTTEEAGEGTDLCGYCYAEAGWENHHSDEGHEGAMLDCAECRSYFERQVGKIRT